MPFVDVGTTERKKLTPTQILQAWERAKGVCVNCKQPIDGTRDKWFVEHVRALELGGEDTAENRGPAHYACKREKDADDHRRAAKAKRAKRADLGIRRSSHPLPGGRNSPVKIKMDGTVIDRRTGEIVRRRSP